MTDLDDKQLLVQLRNPSTRRKAFEALVRQYGQQIYWRVRGIVLVHEDADDVVQNVFAKVWSKLDDFHGESKLSTWLYRIAVNESLDFLRRQKARLRVDADFDASVATRLMADEWFDGDRGRALLHEAVASLPDVQREVFTLRYFQEMHYKDISEQLGTSVGALKASYHIAAKKIVDYIRSHD